LAAGSYGSPPAGVLSVQFTQDGRIVSVGRDRVIRIWGTDGKPRGASPVLPSLPIKVAATFDNGTMIAGDYDGKLTLWDGQTLSTILAASASPAQSAPVKP